MSLKETITHVNSWTPRATRVDWKRSSESTCGRRAPCMALWPGPRRKLQARLVEVHQESTETEARKDALQREVDALEAQRETLDSTVDQLDRQTKDAQERLEDLKGVVDGAERLAQRGFGEMSSLGCWTSLAT